MQLASSDAAPHAILMMAGKRLFTDTQHPVGADDLAQLFATKERYRCGMPLAGTVRPQTSVLLCSSAER